MDTKSQIIQDIKKVISEWGNTTACERELDHSPCVMSIGNGKNNVCALIEGFNHNGVTVVVYQDELELDEYDMPYEDLENDVLDEVMEIMNDYDADMYKTNKRILS